MVRYGQRLLVPSYSGLEPLKNQGPHLQPVDAGGGAPRPQATSWFSFLCLV